MSSWIKLDQSLSKFQNRNNRNKRIHHDAVPTNIEDDSSSQESCNLNLSSRKKRKLEPLANVKITNQEDSSDEFCDVEYDPDGTLLPTAGKRKTKSTLPIIASKVLPPPQSSTSHATTSTTKLHPWTTWMTIPKSNDEINKSSNIEDSPTDSDPDELSTPDTVIDESSTDSSLIKSQVARQQETMIETQESITPPVAPYLADTKFSKKRKVRMIKGGMVERLKKSMSQAKSNLSFWHHHRSAELITSGTLVTVNRVENTYGRILIHTKVDNEETIFCLCSRLLDIQQGDVIEVKLDVDRSYKTDTHVLYSYVDKVLLINKNV